MRRRWRRSQRQLDPRRLVFIDETAISTSMTRRGGRAARGQRLVCKVPFGAWQSVTMVAALRHDRMTAPMTLNGAMTGDSFRSYIAQVLGPTLRRGDIVVMDNVPLHRTQAVREALEKLGVSVPTFAAYSPDLNPIEPMFCHGIRVHHLRDHRPGIALAEVDLHPAHVAASG